mgnify:FL=1|jgi:hypothetical protein
MANITEILGTDSVSSSRPVINSNFELLNDELSSITALLDPTTATLTNVASVSAGALLLTSGGSSIASINTTEAAFEVDSTFNGALKIGGKLIKTGIVGSYDTPTTNNSPVSIEASTYFVSSTFTLPAAAEGQEVTIISRNASDINVQAAAAVDLGVTSIVLQGAPLVNASVTLRCFNNRWFVISSYGATIA